MLLKIILNFKNILLINILNLIVDIKKSNMILNSKELVNENNYAKIITNCYLINLSSKL